MYHVNYTDDVAFAVVVNLLEKQQLPVTLSNRGYQMSLKRSFDININDCWTVLGLTQILRRLKHSKTFYWLAAQCTARDESKSL